MKDPYVYENTHVLINKLNIKDSDKLDELEGNIVSLNISFLVSNPSKIESLFDIKKIHKVLFSDLYDWAGEFRLINMYKHEPVLDGLSVEYSDYDRIEKDLEILDDRFKSINWKKLNKNDTLNEVILLISKLWRIHCFREGNTRSVTLFLYLLLKQIKYKVNINFIGEHADYFRHALVLASIDEYSEYEHLEKIFKDAISTKIIVDGNKKYQTIREYELAKYKYVKHHIK